MTVYLPSFAFSPHPTFHLINKLDYAFSSLIDGRDIDSGEPLPGAEGTPRLVNVTEKVRLKGIVEKTRLVVLEGKQEKPALDADSEDEDDTDTDNFENATGDFDQVRGDDLDRWDVESARVYERTIEHLGEVMGLQ